MTSGGSSLRGNTLHSTSITEEHVSVVVEKLVTGLVEAGSVVGLGHGKTDGIGETLTEGTGGDLDAGGVMLESSSASSLPLIARRKTYSLGVTRSLGAELAEVLQVVKGDIVTEQVQKSILEHASVTVTNPFNLR